MRPDVEEGKKAFAKFQELWHSLSRPLRLLVVEDDANDIQLINAALKENRLDLRVAVTGAEAKKFIQQSDFDLCLLDLNLPDMDGVEVIRWAKKHNKNIPFFVLTGITDHGNRVKIALDAGAECVIQKPLSAENARMIGSRR